MDTVIRVIDNNFDFKGMIDNYSSFYFVRSYFLAKEFQLICSCKYKDILKDGNIIFIDPKKPLIIEDVIVDENKREITAKGRDLKSILDRRVITPPNGQGYDSFKGNAEDVIKHYVLTNSVNPVDSKRKIDRLVIAPNLNRGSNINWKSRYKYLNKEISDICGTTGLGWQITLDLDNKNFIFDVIEGKDLTAGVNKVLFGEDFNNITDVTSSKITSNYKTMAIIAGQGEDINRKVEQVFLNDSEGLERREMFIDARDIENTEDNKLTDRAIAKLKENSLINNVESTVLNKPFVYEKDWNLGDIVIRKIDNAFENLRVTEVTEVYENNFKIDLTLGDLIPGLFK